VIKRIKKFKNKTTHKPEQPAHGKETATANERQHNEYAI